LAFATIMLVGVLFLGLVLGLSYRAEATRRGLAQGRSEAVLMAQTAIDPRLNGRPLSDGLSAAEARDMDRIVDTAVDTHQVLRLRLRDLAGNVVYSDDGSGLHSHDNNSDIDEILDAAHGQVVAHITRLNADSDDTGPRGPAAVEVYLPLRAGSPSRLVGVLEVYLPYAPIRADVDAGLDNLYRNLAVGLALLYALLVGISYAVGARLRREVKLNAYMAEHDALTDLPNRALFRQMLEDELDHAQREGQCTMIAIIDLDRFKEINDTLGHLNGDHLLRALSSRMVGHFGSRGAVARLGGNEFGVLMPGVDNPTDTLVELRQLIQDEISIGDLPLCVESSIGYAVAPGDATDAELLLQQADVAMYTSKVRHLGVVHFDRSQSHFDASNLALIGELRHAIESDQLVLHYQPKVRIRDGSIDTAEALVRWQHPVLGLLAPDRFVPLAEQTDLIDQLTNWVLRRALNDMKEFGPSARGLIVAVNVSARNLSRDGFAATVVETLRATGVPPDRLYIEITETALMTDPPRAAVTLAQLDDAGVLLSIDDFGAGQTSLGYLSTLPIHELKIDRSFVTDMLTSHGHAAIVNSIVELGHNLGFTVVGEGVDNADVLRALATTGCDVAQGYLFTRPMPAAALSAWLDNYVTIGAFELTDALTS
jgi:diguanylate cyclase (GGDEF)-like protein